MRRAAARKGSLIVMFLFGVLLHKAAYAQGVPASGAPASPTTEAPTPSAPGAPGAPSVATAPAAPSAPRVPGAPAPAPAPLDASATAALKQHLERGVDCYKRGSYDEAAVAFWNAYYLRPDPKILFNIAQAYRKSGQREQAISLFQRYQREEPGSPLTLEAATLEAQLQAELDAQKQADSRQHSDQLTQTNRVLYEKLSTVMVENERLREMQKERRPVYKNPWLWVGIASGVAVVTALTVGLVLGLPKPLPEAALGTRTVNGL